MPKTEQETTRRPISRRKRTQGIFQGIVDKYSEKNAENRKFLNIQLGIPQCGTSLTPPTVTESGMLSLLFSLDKKEMRF